VEETGLLVTLSDIFPEKTERHFSYQKGEIPLHLK